MYHAYTLENWCARHTVFFDLSGAFDLFFDGKKRIIMMRAT